MGGSDGWGSPFFAAEDCNNSQLLLLTLAYSVILYYSSNLISDGSELLLLIPSVAGLVGSIVLPILGAVPDGMMTLMSGIGPDAQNEISVGVGVMAGSTIMLLTFPWFIAVMFGRVPLNAKGEADYSKRKERAGLFNSGVSYDKSIRSGACIMLGTTLLFLLIQGPATVEEEVGAKYKEMTRAENPWALGGLIGSMACFCGYLLICYTDANADKRIEAIITGIKSGKVSLAAALKFEQNEVTTSESGTNVRKSRQALLEKKQGELNRILKPFFTRYDKDEPRGSIDEKEFEFVCSEMGIQERHAKSLFTQFKNVHTIGPGKECDAVNFPGFVEIMKRTIVHKDIAGEQAVVEDAGADEDEEEELPPEDLKELPEGQQRRRIAMRAVYQMGLGTFLVLVFSDPFVEVLSEWGKRMGIPGFYVSFVLAPFASNASELLSAYNYALKKTKASITTSFSTLIGAACMNNTFCLGIFLALVWYKQLAWKFTAETISIMFSQWLIGALCFVPSKTHTVPIACVILAVYPLCIALVYVLENYCGLD